MTFKLYKAQFKPSATLTWYNSSVLPKGDNSTVLEDNPIQGLPRKLKLDISGSGTLNASVVPGIKVKESAAGDTVSGFVENIGGPAATIELAAGGSDYYNGSTGSGVSNFSTLTDCDLFL